MFCLAIRHTSEKNRTSQFVGPDRYLCGASPMSHSHRFSGANRLRSLVEAQPLGSKISRRFKRPTNVGNCDSSGSADMFHEVGQRYRTPEQIDSLGKPGIRGWRGRRVAPRFQHPRRELSALGCEPAQFDWYSRRVPCRRISNSMEALCAGRKLQ